MKIHFDSERVLAVIAHPDDEFLCAGTLARAAADGAAIGICVLCRGDKGQPDPPVDDLAAVRQREMRASAAVVGAELFEGGFSDGALFDSPETRLAVTELYRRFRPTLVLAHWSGDYHADHRAASAIAEAATWFAASAGQKTASQALAQPPSLWWMDTVNMQSFEPQMYVDISEHVELKRRMIRCHASQIARGSNLAFSPLEEMMLAQNAARGAQSGVAAAEAFRPHQAWKRTRAW
jgi:LmbE family N-acetylglucosaminyl deacetylase